MHVTIRNKTLLVVMFVTIATVTAARDETYTFDRQSCLDYAIKFARPVAAACDGARDEICCARHKCFLYVLYNHVYTRIFTVS